jgi:BASS family bile acid:Na+ symporter
MLVRARAYGFASRAERLVRVISVVVLAIFSVIAIGKNSEALREHAQLVGAACVVFNLLSMSLGYALPRALGLSAAQAIAVAMEVGIHNAALAIYIAINVLGDGVYAIPAAVYSVVMFVTATLFTGWMARKSLRS